MAVLADGRWHLSEPPSFEAGEDESVRFERVMQSAWQTCLNLAEAGVIRWRA